MNSENKTRDERANHESPEDRPGSSRWMDCLGAENLDVGRMMKSCPCASFRGSRGWFAIPLVVAGLIFTMCLLGWVLGVVAFFRGI